MSGNAVAVIPELTDRHGFSRERPPKRGAGHPPAKNCPGCIRGEVILSGDQFRPQLAPRLAVFFEQLALGTRPIVERISGGAAAFQINLIRAQRDILGCRMDSCCSGLLYFRRGAFPRLGHICSPFNCSLHLTFGRKQSLKKSLKRQSKDSIH
jgi:hypothetical protein